MNSVLNCLNSLSNPETVNLVNYASTALFGALVAILTIYRTGRTAWQSRKANISRALSYILLRDGSQHMQFV